MDAIISLQDLWDSGYTPWDSGKYPWGLVATIPKIYSSVVPFESLWGSQYFPWLNSEYPWIEKGVIGGTGKLISPSVISSTSSMQTASESMGTGVSKSVSVTTVSSSVLQETLKTDAILSPNTITARVRALLPSQYGKWIWTIRDGVTTGWTNRTKPTTNYNNRTKPNTDWTHTR